jgi:hypothetical protein
VADCAANPVIAPSGAGRSEIESGQQLSATLAAEPD